jgi:hydrogenase maturation protein HypF
MITHLAAVRSYCHVSEGEEERLRSAASPIVLLRRRTTNDDLGPDNPYLGVMLPYAPLHHLLLADLGFPVVATSGNRAGEPICTDERAALARLAGVADLFLVHNRPITRPVDDSVVRFVLGREMVIRRARGYAPLPVTMKRALPPLLAVGGQLKNTIAVSVGNDIILSQHLGDLGSAVADEAFRQAVTSLTQLHGMQPDAVACDQHPAYHSTRFAEQTGLPVRRVQHHYAHVLACMAEHGLEGSVLGVAWDGTGFGTDGTVWGGEFLRVTGDGFTRVAHLRPFRLPGGEQAVREPRRSAFGLLHELGGEAWTERTDLAAVEAFAPPERRLLRTMVRQRLNSPLTTSVGRLFDAVAALLGLCQRARFEGEAAMALEFAAEDVTEIAPCPFHFTPDGIMDWGPLIEAVLKDIVAGETLGRIAAQFHATLAAMVVAAARRVGDERVVLTGGCFQNARLLEPSVTSLRAAGFIPFWPRQVPPNDGGLALGQIIAAARTRSSE